MSGILQGGWEGGLGALVAVQEEEEGAEGGEKRAGTV